MEDRRGTERASRDAAARKGIIIVVVFCFAAWRSMDIRSFGYNRDSTGDGWSMMRQGPRRLKSPEFFF